MTVFAPRRGGEDREHAELPGVRQDGAAVPAVAMGICRAWRRQIAAAVVGLTLAANSSRAAAGPESPRHEFDLDFGWRTVAAETNAHRFDGFEQPGFDARSWRVVEVPHNWDDYGGEHRLVHGNLHGTAWYRRDFDVPATERGRRIFLYFEGVGSYATVWLNGKLAGHHAGGRTTFTLDVTPLVYVGGKNTLAVRADHPAGITDLPWVCGGCSEKPGFSEGSQPMGIFRPVHLITTNDVRVVPFGVHVWNDADATSATAKVHITTELANDGATQTLTIESRVLGPNLERDNASRETDPEPTPPRDGHELRSAPAVRVRTAAAGAVGSPTESIVAKPGIATITQSLDLHNVALWSLESPNLYTVETTVRVGDRVLDRVETKFGIRTIRWPGADAPPGSPFLLNGKPVFINGTCEYEHLLGASHAFSEEQIAARVAQIRAAGFNAFRDAHQPHNLRYQQYWDREGLLWWPQFAAQIWFDTPEFRANFKALLRDWVRERRNSPSLVLWGLANESKLLPDFAAECVALIRELDPTSPSQRLVTTCNSGKGTDWNVPQNWSGTYGGNPATYADDLKRERLVGEYGAWRSLALHSEGGFVAKGIKSEDRAAGLLEMKVRLAESVRNQVAGHFQWLFATHDNPGRTIGSEGQQGADGWPELDRIGPANNKGLLTLWGEPTDLYYLYRGNYAPAASDPMVYIVSHTWPDRWAGPGRKSGIVVYSNCDEVELFNDVGGDSLGVRQRGPKGTHFQWDDVDVRFNVLYAEGRVGGKVVARDAIILKNLPDAPHRSALNGTINNVTAAAAGQNYVYRVNCGGPEYTDVNGQRWLADRDFAESLSWGSLSWAMDYANVPARFGSQREIFDPIVGTADQPLFQTYRYGRDKLRYRFAVPDGNYRIELYFAEPWYGAGGGNCAGWRLFDVAVNGMAVLRDVDLWAEVGFAHALKKVVNARVRGGWLEISFPRVASYQAVISAIAIATSDPNAHAPVDEIVTPTRVAGSSRGAHPGSEAARSPSMPSPEAQTLTLAVADARVAGDAWTWPVQLGLGGMHEFQVRYVNPSPATAPVTLTVTSADGTVMGNSTIMLPPTSGPGPALSPTASLSMNAGDYRVAITAPSDSAVKIDALIVK